MRLIVAVLYHGDQVEMFLPPDLMTDFRESQDFQNVCSTQQDDL